MPHQTAILTPSPELLVFVVLGANLLQASYALQYPPTPYPSLAGGTPRKLVPQSPAGSPRPLKGLTQVCAHLSV